MRRCHLVAGLTVFCLAVLPGPAVRAAAPPDPLRLVPEQADFLLKVDQPRRLTETVLALDLLKQLQNFEAAREFYDSTNFRRFLQLIGCFEKALEAHWPDLLDQVAGGGMVLAAKFGENPAPALLVVQAQQEGTLKKFARMIRTLIEQELAQQETKNRLENTTYRKREVWRVGEDLHIAVAGSALLISNRKKALEAALDRHVDSSKPSLATHPRVIEARQLLPADPLAWTWLSLENVRQLPGAKEPLAAAGTDPAQLILFGGWIDQAKHAPYLCAALAKDGNRLLTTLRTPRGKSDLPPALAALHLPAAGDGSLPLLEPKGVLFSASYMLDLAKFWEQRGQLLNEAQVKALEQADQNPGAALAGLRLSKVFTQAGPYQRFVAAQQTHSGYQKKPGPKIPAFAFVISMREPEDFSRLIGTALRTAALAARSQVKLKLTEEKHGDLTLVGYRFPENEPLDGDANDIRFNFSPCFVAVGDQFVISSTLELGHELVDILLHEAKAPVKKHPAASRMQFYAAGAADYLKSIEDQLLAQTILDQALPPAEAKGQVAQFLTWVRQLGVLELAGTYGSKDFRFDWHYTPSK